MPRTKSPRTLKALKKSVSQAKKVVISFTYFRDDQTLLLPNMREMVSVFYKSEGGRLYFRPSEFDGVLLESDRKRPMVKAISNFYLNAWRNMDNLTPEQQSRLKERFREVPVDTSLVYLHL
jgi:hypothetical protein